MLHVMYIIFLLIQVLQLPLQPLNAMWHAMVFWPKFYYRLFGPEASGPSIWAILSGNIEAKHCEVTPSTRVRGGQRNKLEDDPSRCVANRNIVNRYTPFLFNLTSLQPTHERLCLLSSYQVKGAYATLGHHVDQDAVDALRAGMDSATPFKFRADPLRLAAPYKYVAASITEPPDCLLDKIWAFAWHIFWMIVFLATGYTKLLFLRCFKRNTVDTPKTIRRTRSKSKKGKRRRRKTLPTMKVQVFATNDGDSEPERVTWDTDGISFFVDTCANTIISNCRDLFTDLKPVNVTVNTHSGDDQRVRYVGTFNLELPDDSGYIWKYKIPNCIYDPHTQHNILGVVALCNYFEDAADGSDPKATDGTRATSGGSRTHLVWDHGKHELHFMHRTTSQLPEVVLYRGNSYFQAFFSRVSRVYDDMVRYAFCTNYTVEPDTAYVTDDEGEDMEEDDEAEDTLNQKQQWYQPSGQPSYCQPCTASTTSSGYQFTLGENLLYTTKDSEGKGIVATESVVYEGAAGLQLVHTIRCAARMARV